MAAAEVGLYEPSYENLPEPIVLKIFSYLTTSVLAKSVSGVCKSWWELSKDRSLWKEIRVPWKHRCIDQIKTLLVRCTKLEKLIIDATFRGFEGPFHVGNWFSSLSLKHLTIGYAIVFPEELTNLHIRFPELKALSFLRCKMIGTQLQFLDSVIELTALSCLRLNILELSPYFHDEFLSTIAETFTNLETLQMHGTTGISNECIQNLVQLRQDKLKEVRIVGTLFTDEAVSSFSVCRELVHLCLACTANITNASFDALEDLKLETLEFHVCTKKNDLVSREALSKYFSNPSRRSLVTFKLIGFENFSDDVLSEVARNCHNLVEVTIGGTELVSFDGLESLNVLPRIAKISVVECVLFAQQDS